MTDPTWPDPATPEWRETSFGPSVDVCCAADGGSTSAQLRETQAALAASQADLTVMERERNEAQVELNKMHRLYREMADQAIASTVERDEARAELGQLERLHLPTRPTPHLDAVKRERDLARAELTSARTELEQLRREVRILGWQLAAVVEFASAYQPNAERGWAIAIVHDKPCATCKRDITCGQAYAPLPGSKGYFVHVVCPPPEDPPSTPVPGHHEGEPQQ
jgi:hypothetical protein